MNAVRNIYKSRVIHYNDDAYDLPLDVVYFIASSWNFRLNNYVYSHKAEIEQLLCEDGGFFPYRLEIISPDRFQEEAIYNGFRGLHPDWAQEVDFSPIFSEKSGNREKTYQAEALKRMMDKTPRFEESFIARIAPSAKEDIFGFYAIDVSLCTESFVSAILHDFIRDLTQFNLTALSSGIDYSDDSVQEKVCYTGDGSISFTGKHISFCGNTKTEPINVADKIGIDPALRELAMRIKQEIDGYQRANGVNTLLEKLGDEFIKSVEGIQLKPLSSLEIDNLYNIRLPEYNKKIEMNTLPKTIYVFFLRHPQGIILKDLSDHRQELKQIYMTMTRQSISHEEAYKKIDGLLDFTNGHLNQYICRISESFRKELSSGLAKKYAIDGQRNGLRRILLQPDKIKLPEQLKF